MITLYSNFPYIQHILMLGLEELNPKFVRLSFQQVSFQFFFQEDQQMSSRLLLYSLQKDLLPLLAAPFPLVTLFYPFIHPAESVSS